MGSYSPEKMSFGGLHPPNDPLVETVTILRRLPCLSGDHSVLCGNAPAR